MTSTNFVYHDIYIRTNETLPFSNPTSGEAQILCVGQDGDCAPDGSGPAALTHRGLLIKPGQSIPVTFDVAGDYPIISLNTPGMTTTIHVSTSPGVS